MQRYDLKDKVLVFGATSYVGSFLIEELSSHGFSVVAVVRDSVTTRMLLPSLHEKAEVVMMGDTKWVQNGHEEVAGIVNLAYVKNLSNFGFRSMNRNLIEGIHRCAMTSRARRVVHVSTQAVFGYSFKTRPTPRRVRENKIDPYIETKIQAEHLWERLASAASYNLAIVRLGNVIGPGSPAWTGRLAQRILEGRVLPSDEQSGYSNATYVKNVANYVKHILTRDPVELNTFGSYHHLAEFSPYSWYEILYPMAEAIGRGLVSVREAQRARRLRKELPGRLIRVASASSAGQRLRSILLRLPRTPLLENVVEKLKGLRISDDHLMRPGIQDASDRALMDILRSDVRFDSHTLGSWVPPIDFSEAMLEICEWLKEANYTISA